MANSAPRPLTSYCAVAGLMASLVFAVWWRGHTVGPTLCNQFGVALWPMVRGEAEPLDCDEAVYAYVGRRMLLGDRLYADLSEPKPPLGYCIYAGAIAIGGDNELTIRLSPIPFVLGSVALVWWIGLRLGGALSAVVAAFLAVLLSADPYLYGNGAHLEHPINLFSLGAFAAVVVAERTARAQGAWLLVAGLSLGLATLVKQVAALHLVVFGAAALAMAAPHRAGRASGPERGKALALLLTGFVVPLAMAAAILAMRGGAAEAYDDIVRHGLSLASDVHPVPNAPSPAIRWLTGNADPSGALPAPFGKTDYLVWWGRGSWPIWLAAAPCLVWLTFVRASFERRVLVAWTVSALAQVVAPGLYWPHYYLLPAPGLALAVALTLDDLTGSGRQTSWEKAFSAGLIGAIVALGAIQVRDYLLVPADQLTVRFKGGRQWVEMRTLGRLLARRTADWEAPKLQIWGWQSPLLFYSKLDASSRYFFTNNLIRDYADRRHPVVSPQITRLMADLHEKRPDLVLVTYLPFAALRDFVGEHYLRSDLYVSSPDGRGLWVRKDRWADFNLEKERFSPSMESRSR